MFPSYEGYRPNLDLAQDDIAGIQVIWDTCAHAFKTLFLCRHCMDHLQDMKVEKVYQRNQSGCHLEEEVDYQSLVIVHRLIMILLTGFDDGTIRDLLRCCGLMWSADYKT